MRGCRTRVRCVDVASEGYGIARRFMIRLEPSDLADPEALARIAATAGLTPDEFRDRFGYLADLAPPGLVIG